MLTATVFVQDVTTALVGKNGRYAIDYEEDTSEKRMKTLRNNMVSNTAVWITSYDRITCIHVEGTAPSVPRNTGYVITFEY
jgi:hypothetical protein